MLCQSIWQNNYVLHCLIEVKMVINTKMNLEEAKKLFEENFPSAEYHIKNNTAFKREAECMWNGFKSALKLTGLLIE